jgi:hypothetical protein
MPLVFFYGVDMLIGWSEFPSPDVAPSGVIDATPAGDEQPATLTPAMAKEVEEEK